MFGKVQNVRHLICELYSNIREKTVVLGRLIDRYSLKSIK